MTQTVKSLRGVVYAAVLAGAIAAVPAEARGQGTSGQAQAPTLATQSTQVDVVLTRYQGEKKTSSLPFTLMVNASSRNSGQTSIRMGVDVPVGTSTSNVTQTSGAQTNSSRAVGTTKVDIAYRNVGTDIDCMVNRVDETTYSVYVNIHDSSLFSQEAGKIPAGTADAAAFRTFSTANTQFLKDGQTRLFGVATDKVTGETLRIEVKLTVLK